MEEVTFPQITRWLFFEVCPADADPENSQMYKLFNKSFLNLNAFIAQQRVKKNVHSPKKRKNCIQFLSLSMLYSGIAKHFTVGSPTMNNARVLDERCAITKFGRHK